MILALGDFLVILAITFAGDHMLIQGLPSMLLIWIALLVYRTITNLSVKESEVIVQCGLVITLTPFCIAGIVKADVYYYSFLFIILYFNAFPIIHRMIYNKYLLFVIVGFFLFMLPFIFTVWGGNRWTSQEVLLFGPNIMYRIYAFSFFLMIVNLVIHEEKRFNIALLFVYIASLVGLISTGSRGATVLILVETLVVLYYFRRSRMLQLASFALVSLSVYFIVINWELLSDVLGRLVYFDLTNASEKSRLLMIYNFFAFIETESSSNLLFGVGNDSIYYPNWYPHNIIIESIVYHGFIYSLLLFLVIVYAIRLSITDRRLLYIVGLFSPMILGSMLSGSYLENFSILSLALYIIYYKRYPSSNLYAKRMKEIPC